MGQNKLVVVYTTQGAMLAEVIKSKLESRGIPAMIKSESQSVIPMIVDGIGKAEVLVPPEFEQQARAALEEEESNDA